MQAACRDVVGFFVLPCAVPLFTSCFYPTESLLPGAGAEAPPGQLWGCSCSGGGFCEKCICNREDYSKALRIESRKNNGVTVGTSRVYMIVYLGKKKFSYSSQQL